jgi:hypothetical protein
LFLSPVLPPLTAPSVLSTLTVLPVLNESWMNPSCRYRCFHFMSHVSCRMFSLLYLRSQHKGGKPLYRILLYLRGTGRLERNWERNKREGRDEPKRSTGGQMPVVYCIGTWYHCTVG